MWSDVIWLGGAKLVTDDAGMLRGAAPIGEGLRDGRSPKAETQPESGSAKSRFQHWGSSSSNKNLIPYATHPTDA